MDKWHWGALVYGLWFLLWLIIELIGWRARKAPWPTLSEEAWWAQRRYRLLRIVIPLGLAILTIHIAAGWP